MHPSFPPPSHAHTHTQTCKIPPPSQLSLFEGTRPVHHILPPFFYDTLCATFWFCLHFPSTLPGLSANLRPDCCVGLSPHRSFALTTHARAHRTHRTQLFLFFTLSSSPLLQQKREERDKNKAKKTTQLLTTKHPQNHRAKKHTHTHTLHQSNPHPLPHTLTFLCHSSSASRQKPKKNERTPTPTPRLPRPLVYTQCHTGGIMPHPPPCGTKVTFMDANPAEGKPLGPSPSPLSSPP